MRPRALAALLLVLAAPAAAETIAITGGTVALGDGSAAMPGGTVVIRDGRVADAALRADLAALRDDDVRVATIGYRLATAAVPLCTPTPSASGLVVAVAAQYRADIRGEAADLFHLGGAPAVTGVVAGSPAARAGVAVGDGILALNGTDLTSAGDPDGRQAANGDAYGAIVAALEAAFAAGPVTLSIERAGRPLTVRFAGAPACPTAFQLVLDNRMNAGANGTTVSITRKLLSYAGSDDEAAFILAHELSHNVLGHRRLLALHGRERPSVRETEMQADYTGVYIMALAGYDPNAAAAFWTKMRERRGLLWMSDGTHLSDRARTAFLADAAAEVLARRAARQPLRPDYQAFIAAGA